MVNLPKLVTLLDAVYHCGNRKDCYVCRIAYRLNPKDNICPIWMNENNRDNTLEALRAIEHWLDNEYDTSAELGTEAVYEVNEEDFMKILTGEYE